MLTQSIKCFHIKSFDVVQSLSHVQLFATPIDCNMPGFPVLHCLPEFTQIHLHWVSDANKLSLPPYSHLPLIFRSIRVFWNESDLWIQSIGASASASFLPMNNQGWFPLGWTGWISLQSKGLWRVFSNTTVQKHQFFGPQFLYGPTLTLLHDYWKNHSFDYMDLCQQSDVSAF